MTWDLCLNRCCQLVAYNAISVYDKGYKGSAVKMKLYLGLALSE